MIDEMINEMSWKCMEAVGPAVAALDNSIENGEISGDLGILAVTSVVVGVPMAIISGPSMALMGLGVGAVGYAGVRAFDWLMN